MICVDAEPKNMDKRWNLKTWRLFSIKILNFFGRVEMPRITFDMRDTVAPNYVQGQYLHSGKGEIRVFHK